VEPSVAYIIPYWGTNEHRERSFYFVQDVLMGYYKDLGLDNPAKAYTRGEAKTRSGARNELAKKAIKDGVDLLVFLDADSIMYPGFINDSLTHVMHHKSWILPYTTYYNLTIEGSLDFRLNPPWYHWRPEDGYEYEYVFPGPDPVERPPAVGGCVIVHRDAFEKVNGYDERFQGWGGEDRAFVLALKTLVGDSFRYPAPIYHLWHPAPETERFDHPDWDYNRPLLRQYEEAVGYPQKMSALVNSR
jgi:N-terminal domain of galactosyltransferase